MDLAKSGYLLDLAADTHTSATQDALLRVAHDRGARDVAIVVLPLPLKEPVADA